MRDFLRRLVRDDEDLADLNLRVDMIRSSVLLDAALASDDTDVLRVTAGAHVLPVCQRKSPDLVILDLQIGNMGGMATCRSLKQEQEQARLEPFPVGLLLDRQVDTYFRTRSGRLKLRESSLSGGQLVPYLREDTPGPKRADYRVVPVDDAPGLRRLLGDILGVHRVVTKIREIFLVDHVRIHLDRVDGLGEFVELEAVFDGSPDAEALQHRTVERLMTALGVAADDLVATSYEALLADAHPRD